MKQFLNKCIMFFAVCSLTLVGSISQVSAEQVRIAGDFTITVPAGWEKITSDYNALTNDSAARVLDCVQDRTDELKMVGWKLNQAGKLEGAFCISYTASGMNPVRSAIKSQKSKNRDKTSASFMDLEASRLVEGYAKKKNMRMAEMSADLLEAGSDVVMILDCKINDGKQTLTRSSTIYLHKDVLVNFSVVHALDAPDQVLNELDALPLSIQWRYMP